jgi:glucokinase
VAEALFIGLDLGGTEVKAGLARDDGALLWRDRTPSRAREGGEAILAALAAAAERAIAEATRRGGSVRALGLGTPGIVDRASGRIRYPVANLGGWHGTDLAGSFRDRFGFPAVIENDANAAAWGEFRRGAGRGARSLVMATVGTGIGGGAVIDGALLRGAGDAAMELGHSVFIAGGRACPCGLAGCLEAYAGGRTMAEEWSRRRAPGGAAAQLGDLLAAERAGDPLAAEVLDEGARALGHGLVSALHLLNPGVLVIGGGIIAARPRHRELALESLRAHILPKALDGLATPAAALGNDAGVVGALLIAAESVGATGGRRPS